jgi:(S)-sulfolactate dehydrogenase
MARIVITEFMDEASVEELAKQHNTLYDPTLVDDPDRLMSMIADVDALIVRNRTQVRGALLDAAGALKCVGRLGVGLDNIDVEACGTKGVKVYPATGANDASVAEYVVTTAMMLRRGAYVSSSAVASGDWPRQALIGREIGGSTLGLIGFGAIARETARRFKALGAEVIAFDPFVDTGSSVWVEEGTTPVTLETLLTKADVVSLHVPLTADTRNLVDGAALRSMKSDAVLINAARGGVVDEAALAETLRSGHLAGAALDVFDAEPLSAENGAHFADIGNVILTPHIAGVTEESNVRVSSLIAELIAAHLRD